MSDPMLPGGTDKCRCPTCKVYFNSTYAFDQHRKGKIGTPERRCLSLVEMACAGWKQGSQGHWRSPSIRGGPEAVHLRQSGIKPEAI